MSNVGQNMYCAYTNDVKEILMFKNFKGFKKKAACETADN
jgi:hypothetical protein